MKMEKKIKWKMEKKNENGKENKVEKKIKWKRK